MPSASARQNCQNDEVGTIAKRFYRSTFGGHSYRTITGIILLTLLLFLLFLSPALFPLPFLGAIAVALQNTFTTILAKTLTAIFGGFLAFTAPKWFGNLCQFMGIRLLGGLLGRIIFLLMVLTMVATFIAVLIIGVVPFLLFTLYTGKSSNYLDSWSPFTKFAGDFAFLFGSLLVPPLIITCSLGAIINTLGIILSGEYHNIPEKPNSGDGRAGSENNANSSMWNKILLALDNPIPAVETLKHDPAIINHESRLIWAEKYDHFCDSFRFESTFFGNLCYAKEREKFFFDFKLS